MPDWVIKMHIINPRFILCIMRSSYIGIVDTKTFTLHTSSKLLDPSLNDMCPLSFKRDSLKFALAGSRGLYLLSISDDLAKLSIDEVFFDGKHISTVTLHRQNEVIATISGKNSLMQVDMGTGGFREIVNPYEQNGKCFYLSVKPVVVEAPAGETKGVE